jgi:hypothetical protein
MQPVAAADVSCGFSACDGLADNNSFTSDGLSRSGLPDASIMVSMEKMIAEDRDMNTRTTKIESQSYAPFLCLLLATFVMRVLGQLLVVLHLAPWLPALSEWQSGLLPYSLLLVAQLAIIGLFSKVCLDFASGTGFFVQAKSWLGKPLRAIGAVYFAAMPIRYALYMALVPEARWLGGTIPVLLHMVLAMFLLTVSRFQISMQTDNSSDSNGLG